MRNRVRKKEKELKIRKRVRKKEKEGERREDKK